jgi:hypothetical protein
MCDVMCFIIIACRYSIEGSSSGNISGKFSRFGYYYYYYYYYYYSPLCRVFTIMFLKETMPVGYTVYTTRNVWAGIE